jgi:hypothetical protein
MKESKNTVSKFIINHPLIWLGLVEALNIILFIIGLSLRDNRKYEDLCILLGTTFGMLVFFWPLLGIAILGSVEYYKMKNAQNKHNQKVESTRQSLSNGLKTECGTEAYNLMVSLDGSILSWYDAMQSYALVLAGRPSAPTYTQGVIKGSLADNISTLSNAQKKADYDASMKSYYERYGRCLSEKRAYCNRVIFYYDKLYKEITKVNDADKREKLVDDFIFIYKHNVDVIKSEMNK